MSTSRLIIALFLILFGISILTGISLFKFAFALLIIALGVKMLLGDRSAGLGRSTNVSEDFVNEVIIFSAGNKLVKSGNFRGGKVVGIFAGDQLDLSHVRASEKNISLDLVAIFGGIKVIVPENWKVNSEGTAIFGGYDNKTNEGTGETVLNIKGTAIFGGVEIIN